MASLTAKYASREFVQVAGVTVGITGGFTAGAMSYYNWVWKNKLKEPAIFTTYIVGLASATGGAVAGFFAPELVVAGAVTYCGYRVYNEVTGPRSDNLA